MSELNAKAERLIRANAVFEAALALREQAREVSSTDQNLADALEAGAMALGGIWCSLKGKEEDEVRDYEVRASDAAVSRLQRKAS